MGVRASTARIRRPTSWARATLPFVAGVSLLVAPGASAKPRLERPADPVVVSGSQTEALLGSDPRTIVAFRVDQRRRWRQIPVQVDERRDVNLGDVYNGTREGIEINTYADPSTLTGADPIPSLDDDDEIALMARHAGARRGRGHWRKLPRRLRRRDAVELRITDPRSGARRWAYLLDAAATKRDPSAGKNLVEYRFRLLSGGYPASYQFRDGPNPESSVVETGSYRLRFTDRWINDVIEIRRPGTETADLLDRRKAQFGPGFCGRSTDTFTDGEGAFVANIDGPVRAIRSYVGANSGPMTQREHIFYARREDTTTFLRVHQIPGVMEFFDYAPTPERMYYRSSTSAAVPIDGSPDPIPEAAPEWEQVYGPHGAVTSVGRLETDFEGLPLSSYYLDEATPTDPDQLQCTGDGLAWGSSGTRVHGPIANTDTLRGPAGDFRSVRSIFYDGPGLRRGDAARRANWIDQPLLVRGRPAGLGSRRHR